MPLGGYRGYKVSKLAASIGTTMHSIAYQCREQKIFGGWHKGPPDSRVPPCVAWSAGAAVAPLLHHVFES